MRDASLCASLRDDELSALSGIGRARSVVKGQVVVWEGDPTICANLVSGVLKLSSSAADGREQIVGLLFPGDFVGQPFAEESSLTVTAVGDADLCVYPREAFETVVDDHPRLERMLLRRTMASLDEARARMVALGLKSALEKVAAFLVDMGERAAGPLAPGRPCRFDLPLSRAQMADVLGLTIETVSRQMTVLKASGLIALSGHRTVTIHDPARLPGFSSN